MQIRRRSTTSRPSRLSQAAGIGAEALMNHGRYEERRVTVFGGYVAVALV